MIEQKSTGNVIGTCSYVSFDDSYKVAEIGYSILRELWGRGICNPGRRSTDRICV